MKKYLNMIRNCKKCIIGKLRAFNNKNKFVVLQMYGRWEGDKTAEKKLYYNFYVSPLKVE